VTSRGQLAGRTLVSRYEVLDLIGAGGMGDVYRARDRELDEMVALKVVRDDLLAVPDALERFRLEVKLARRVTHRNVARAYELVVTPEVTFCTMELIDGMSLQRRLGSGRRLSVADAASIVASVCDALTAAHAANIVHRDVKPENILLAEDGRVVLTDFGIAAAVRGGEGELSGTPRYMAPEQEHADVATPAADVFALGVVFYEMLTGVPAFAGENAREILDNKQRVDHLILDGFDPRLIELVARATARVPASRLHSASAFRRGVAPFVHEAPREEASISVRRATGLPMVLVRCPPDGIAPSHLVEGFHQAVVDRLVQWPRLRVTTRAADDRELSGLVEIAVDGDEVALTATARPQALVLRLPFDVDSLQRSADQAARLIATVMGCDTAPPPLRTPAMSGTAFELVLRARHQARRDRRTITDAIELCRHALELAPGNPRVEATLATCLAQLSFYARHPAPTLLDDASTHALAALAADPDLAEAHFARAQVELHRGRPVIAAVCFRAAIARAPLMAEAHEWLGRMLFEAGFIVDALARLDDAFSIGALPALHWEIAIRQALDGRWAEVDRTLYELRDLADRGRGYRLRLASWRGPPDADDAYGEMVAAPSETFERTLQLALYDPVKPWAARRDAILALITDPTLLSARRRAFLAQLASEAAGAAADVETCLSMLLRANAHGLFDLHWLDRCPLLASVRPEPRFAIIRADVAARAEAIHDALYGDHRDEATVVTAVPR